MKGELDFTRDLEVDLAGSDHPFLPELDFSLGLLPRGGQSGGKFEEISFARKSISSGNAARF